MQPAKRSFCVLLPPLPKPIKPPQTRHMPPPPALDTRTPQARRLITNLVVRSPAQRWSSLTCHRNAMFQSGDDTDQKKIKWDSIMQMSRIAELRQLMPSASPSASASSAPAPGGLPAAAGSGGGGGGVAALAALAHVAVSFVVCEGMPTPAPEQSRSGYGGGGTSMSACSVASSRRRATHKAVPVTLDDSVPGAHLAIYICSVPCALKHQPAVR